MNDVSSGFPTALSYKIKTLEGNMSRVGCKMTPDRTSGILPSDTITIKLPNNALVDLQTFNLFFKITTSGAVGTFILPRYTSSLIERVSVSVNSQIIDMIQNYNLLYNVLMDLEGSDVSQFNKRNITEWFDPSLNFSDATLTGSEEVAITASKFIQSGATAPTNYDGSICNWLGFLGSTSTKIIDTSSLGDVFVTIQFATGFVLPSTINSTLQSLSGASFTLSDVYATCDCISFSDNTYYEILASKLANGALNIGFNSYLNARFPKAGKGAPIEVVWNISGNSTDQLIATMLKSNYSSTLYPMIVYGQTRDGASANTFTMSQIAANPLAYVNNDLTGGTQIRTTYPNLGDGFMNSYYFIRAGQGIRGSRFSINNRPLNYDFLSPKEIFLETMKSLGYNHLDISSAGLNMCIFSIQHFLKYYFAHIHDLTIQDTSRDFWLSGLNSLGSTMSVGWSCTFNSGSSMEVIPVLYARQSKILSIASGRNITVI